VLCQVSQNKQKAEDIGYLIFFEGLQQNAALLVDHTLTLDCF
jgi:hypothetical protein